MRILLIKTSSMGDVIHTLPALTDAGKMIPHIRFSGQRFAEIPKMHPLVDRVIPVALRRWRKKIFTANTRHEWSALRQLLNQTHYDLVLDAQGLVKSAFLAYFAKGLRVGLDWHSAREALASMIYQKKYPVHFKQHAIPRMRKLFAQALHYPLSTSEPNFGLRKELVEMNSQAENYLVFLHGTTWDSKLWPEEYWKKLADYAQSANLKIKMSGGNEEEMARAYRIAEHANNVEVLPRLTIRNMTQLLVNAKGVIAVDTGFGHLAAALNVPTISLYGATDATLTGALGARSIHLSAQFDCAPCLKRTCQYAAKADVKPACFQTVSPERVWDAGINNFKDTTNDMRRLNYVGYGNYFPVASDYYNKGIRENSRIQIVSYPNDVDLHIDKDHTAVRNIGGLDEHDSLSGTCASHTYTSQGQCIRDAL